VKEVFASFNEPAVCGLDSFEEVSR